MSLLMKPSPNDNPIKTIIRDRRDLYILGAIWLVYLLGNTIWVVLDKFPPTWDSAHHLTMTLVWLDFIKSPSLSGLKAAYAASSYPPLPYLLVTPFYMLFGKSEDVAILGSSSVWLGLLLLATYGLGKRIYNRRAGLLAAAIVSLYPIIIALERDFWLDLQLITIVTITLWALLRIVNFDRWGRAIFLGLSLGIGTWIKWPFSFFIIAPFLFVVFQVWKNVGWTKTRLTNLFITLILSGILALLQYLFNFLFLSGDIYNLSNILQLVTGFAAAANHPPWYTLQGMVYYLTALVNHQASFLFALLFLCSLPAFLQRDVRGRSVLILTLLVPYILATLLPVKEQRITVPYLSSVAVISAVGLSKIRIKNLQTLGITVILFIGVFQWWVTSWGLSILPDHVYIANSWVHFAIFDQKPVSSPRDYSLQPEDWKLEEVMDVITLDAERHAIPMPTLVPIIANTAAYNPNTFNYYSRLYNMNIQFSYVWSWSGEPISLETYPYSYLVWKNGQNIEIEGWDKQDIERAETFLFDHSKAFSLIYKSPLPDGSEVQIFRRSEILDD